MFVNVLISKRNPDDVVAFVKAQTKKHGEINVLSFFERNTPAPQAGQRCEVMICGMVPHRVDGGYVDYDKVPKHFILRTPQPEDMRVLYEGFECSTSMCTTTTSGFKIEAGETRSYAQLEKIARQQKAFDRLGRNSSNWISMITPGRLQQWLHVADHVNVRHDEEYETLIPGIGWVQKVEGRHRLNGVESVAELNI